MSARAGNQEAALAAIRNGGLDGIKPRVFMAGETPEAPRRRAAGYSVILLLTV